MANRETQIGIEVVVDGSPKVRATQVGIEAVVTGSATVRLTQIGIEIMVPTVPNPPPQLFLEMMLP